MYRSRVFTICKSNNILPSHRNQLSTTFLHFKRVIIVSIFQGSRIVEERLDDAINVLRNHAECQSIPPQFSGSVPVSSQFHQYHIVSILYVNLT